MCSTYEPQKPSDSDDVRAIVALDVGGTTIESAVVSSAGEAYDSTMMKSDAMSEASSSILLAHLTGIVEEQVRRAKLRNLEVVGVGFAFPGPFDYDSGICLIQGLNKFESIYGLSLKEHFAHSLGFREDTIHFMNDADAFALGEALYGVGKPYHRTMYLTLGTGIGSAFVESGRIANTAAPYEGRIFQAPYRDGVADDYVSRRGILRMAHELGYHMIGHDVEDIADFARRGDEIAISIFREFGMALSSVLRPVCELLELDAIVFGGQISKSSNLFEPSLREGLHNWTGDIVTTINALESTWHGIYHEFFQSLGAGRADDDGVHK